MASQRRGRKIWLLGCFCSNISTQKASKKLLSLMAPDLWLPAAHPYCGACGLGPTPVNQERDKEWSQENMWPVCLFLSAGVPCRVSDSPARNILGSFSSPSSLSGLLRTSTYVTGKERQGGTKEMSMGWQHMSKEGACLASMRASVQCLSTLSLTHRCGGTHL